MGTDERGRASLSVQGPATWVVRFETFGVDGYPADHYNEPTADETGEEDHFNNLHNPE
jgi:hypothetical protein